MKVLNLGCAHEHRFEGWFASDGDFTSQHERGLVECPLCGDKSIVRLPSAPHLNVSKQRDTIVVHDTETQRQSRWMQAVRQLMDNTEDVGERFPEEARRIHYGEIEQRAIRGRASAEDTEALREEGIEVLALAVPAALTGPVQ
jgi:hypothetical protein